MFNVFIDCVRTVIVGQIKVSDSGLFYFRLIDLSNDRDVSKDSLSKFPKIG